MLVLINADRILRLLPIKSCKPPKVRKVLTVVTKKKKKVWICGRTEMKSFE